MGTASLKHALEKAQERIRTLEDGIRIHRDAKGNDRCWLDDVELYKLLPETVAADFALPSKEEFLENCERYHKSRQLPEVPQVVQLQIPEKRVATNGVDLEHVAKNYDGAPKPVDPATGQHKSYWVLSEAERSKGFVRPVRDRYRHLKCGDVTKMGWTIAETYARDPKFYGSTFCITCKGHFPVGEAGEFVWYGGFVLTSEAQRMVQNPGEEKVGT